MGSSSSRRWSKKGKPMEGVEIRKRVMVVADHSTSAKNAVMWALTHEANMGDLLTLLEVVSPHKRRRRKSLFTEPSPHLASSQIASLCKACRTEVNVEALVIQGPKLDSSQPSREIGRWSFGALPSLLNCLIKSSNGKFVEQSINTAQCLAIAVRKPRGGLGGYLVSTRWQKNFWLLA